MLFTLTAYKDTLQAMQEWGSTLREYYGKDDSYLRSDFTINYLGYWTDNGTIFKN